MFVLGKPARRITGVAIALCLGIGCSCGKKKSHQVKTSASATSSVNTPPVNASVAVATVPERFRCPEFEDGHKLGRVANTALTEASGLAVSHRNPSVLWSHNDSGGESVLFAMTEDGQDLGTYHLTKTKLVDWEDLAMGPAETPGEWYLYVGDIGANTKERHRVSVFRILEPKVKLDQKPKKRKVENVTRFDFTYPDEGVHDAETLMVDPRSNDLYIVTKPRDSVPIAYRAKAPLEPERSIVLEEVTKLPIFEQVKRRSSLVTSGDISADGSLIVIRTYTHAFLWLRHKNESVADSLKREPCTAPLAHESQGETIAFSPDAKSYYTVSEGKEPKIFRFDLKPE
jgi:hypothetical protein